MAQHKFTPLDRTAYRFWIGIDYGVETGFAEWDRKEKQLQYVGTIKIHTAMSFLQSFLLDRPGRMIVRVEGAGSVKRDARIWQDFLLDLGIDFELVAPKNNKTKMRAEAFRKLTGYKPITSSHGRDAAMLVYGY